MEHLNVGSPNPNTNGCGSDACTITITEDESQSDRRTSMILKVPKVLRDIEDHNKCFDPVVLSIGPYHHGNPEFEMVQNLKIACARQFVSDPDLNNFYSKVKEEATKAKAYYDLPMNHGPRFNDDEEFAWMMFLDGCFILHFIDWFTDTNNYSELDKHISIFPLIWRDLFLLENQLPYVVLKAFMSFKYTEAKWQKMVDKFVNAMVNPLGSSCSEDGAESYDQQHLHQSIEVEEDGQQQPLLPQPNGDGGDDQQQPLHLLDLLWTKLVGSRHHDAETSKQSFLKWRSHPSINELIVVGINIKKSKTSCLNDIHFQPTMFGGELLLPQMVIEEDTREMFLNLVAYERGRYPYDCPVSSYLCFMDALIDDADDVKKLRSAGILHNFLGTNEQVADHFNKLAVRLVPDDDTYSQVQMGIDKHYNSKIRVSIGEFVHSHFRGPWSCIVTIAAGFTILLTFLTTIFSLLSYLKVV